MNLKTKILILEHNQNDIGLMRYELEKGGIGYELEIVQTEQEFTEALKKFIPDIVLSDYSLPSFDAPKAFKIKESIIPHIPFILVSGTVGEERAVELIKSGITDYVLKDKLFTLQPKFIRALKETKEKKEKVIAGQQLVYSEAFNRGILNSLNSHIAVVDASGKIVAVNESWKRFASENPECSLISTGEGSNYYEVCERSAKAGARESLDAWQGMEEVMNGERNDFYLEYVCHLLHGKRWFGMRVLKFDSDEHMVVVTHQDITERKLAEESLVQSEARLREAQAISHTGNWELVFGKNIHTWSDELYTIFGIAKERVQPSTELFLSFMHPEDVDDIRIRVDEAFKSLKATSYNFRFVRKDGAIRYGYTERKFEFDKNNRPVRLLGVVQDITDRKLKDDEREKMIASIVQHAKNLEQFAAIVSHNLRAPVANILGLSNVLRNNISKQDRALSQQYLFRATEQLDMVLQDVVKILQARSEINEYKEAVNFGELVAAVKASIHDVIEKEMVRIVADFSAIDGITTIKSYIHSIFYNLISNSIKYRQPGKAPLITIKSEVKNGKVRVLFKDNGVGIDLVKHGDKLFGLYKRFHLHIEGKGLGLFMVKTQIEALGGSISVESRQGGGAEFTIELPL